MIPSKLAVAHHFTVDVEEYFQVSALEPWVDRARWGEFERRARDSTHRIAELLSAGGSRGTFFVLGWLAEREPDLIKALAADGHEIASHGWDHRRVSQQTPAEFRESVRNTKRFLEDITGTEVLGFRAPSFSIVRGCEWALDILVEEGYTYDSSLFPVRRPGYGYSSAQRDLHWLDAASGRLAEVPPATLRWLGLNIPAAGGAYLRLLPFDLVRRALADSERRGVSATLYIHPWELDPDQPRFDVSWPTRIRHYGGLSRTASKLAEIVSEFSFRPIAETLTVLAV